MVALILGFGLLTVTAFVSLSRAKDASEQAKAAVAAVQQEGKNRDYTICTKANEARRGILDYILGSLPPPGQDPEADAMRAEALRRFAPFRCPARPTAIPGSGD